MRILLITLLVALSLAVASCSGTSAKDRKDAGDPPASTEAAGSLRVALSLVQGASLEYGCSSDRIAQLDRTTVALRGLAPGVASVELRDKDAKVHLSGRMDEHGVIQVQDTRGDVGDYQLLLNLLYLLPREGLLSGTKLSEDVQFPSDSNVIIWGKATWALGEEDVYLDRKCRLIAGEVTLDLASRLDGHRTGRIKARLVLRFDPAGKALLAIEAHIRSNDVNPDAVDAAPESTVLLHLRE